MTEKRNSYPPREKIEISEMGAKVDLQSLLNHTASRILKSVDEVMDTIDLVLVCKWWGCDGASGQSRYKQIEHGNYDVDDNDTVFISSLVYLYDFKINLIAK